MLKLLTIEKINCILDAADRSNEEIYSGIAFASADYFGLQISAPPHNAQSGVVSCDFADLVATLDALTQEEQAELAALFYSGRDGADFYAMIPNGRNIAGRNFGAYLGGKRRFAQHVRAGLDKFGHLAKE